ncbi:MAG TPA: hypothetical protein IGR64_17540 [Leptolyngbyaceae cyanobacterium M65_K2018_010]|nr:hypothetical protein [Leptolyngbyaceae cyanobacterium M65_K2018_010]
MVVAKQVLSTAGKVGAIALVAGFSVTACTKPETVETVDGPAVEVTTPTGSSETTTEKFSFADVPSPAGGTVKQLTLAGPETAVVMTCDQQGSVPFLYSDAGLQWVGCQSPSPGSALGPASTLTEPTLNEVRSPLGPVNVPQITLPGPESAVVVACGGNFVPFLSEDKAFWLGCKAP